MPMGKQKFMFFLRAECFFDRLARLSGFALQLGRSDGAMLAQFETSPRPAGILAGISTEMHRRNIAI